MSNLLPAAEQYCTQTVMKAVDKQKNEQFATIR